MDGLLPQQLLHDQSSRNRHQHILAIIAAIPAIAGRRRAQAVTAVILDVVLAHAIALGQVFAASVMFVPAHVATVIVVILVVPAAIVAIMPAAMVMAVVIILPAPAVVVTLILRHGGRCSHHHGHSGKQSQCKQMSFHKCFPVGALVMGAFDTAYCRVGETNQTT